MTLMLAGMLSGEFSRGVDSRAHQRILWHLREQKERIEKLNPASQRNQNSDGPGEVSASIISVEQFDLLQTEIDEYQLATVEALIVQEKLIEAARESLNQILDQAYVMEDGRKVFKDRAGEKVYDVDGNEVEPEMISADSIPDHHPRFEDYWEKRRSLERLEQEQGELLDYQDQLDQTERRLRQGAITGAEFDDLREELQRSAPDTVRGQLDGAAEPELATDPARKPVDLDADLANAIKPNPLGLSR
jgi:hypothetical protein